jgi:hypothetical protein
MQSQMAEAQRRQYLQALGLPQFVAKHDLAASALSSYRIAEVAEAAPEPVATPEVMPAQRTPVSIPAVMPKLMPVVAKPAAEPAPMPTAAMKASVSFACRLFLLGNDRIALLATRDGQDLSSAELMLWRSLCLATAWPVQDGNARFDWPFTYAKHLASDPVAAKDALTAWWQAHCELPSQLFVLGDALTHYVPSNATILPSLADMLASPMLKKMTWQQLQV